MTSYLRLFGSDFIIHFVIFKMKVLVFRCINHNGDGAD